MRPRRHREPVFVDASGRKASRVRRAGVLAVLAAAAYVGAVGVSVFGGPSAPSSADGVSVFGGPSAPSSADGLVRAARPAVVTVGSIAAP